MRLIDADALAEKIEKDMKNGFPANENLSLYAISCIAHAPTVCDIEQIRAEIEAIEINGQVDEHTMFIRTGEQVKQMALDIIDNLMKGE